MLEKAILMHLNFHNCKTRANKNQRLRLVKLSRYLACLLPFFRRAKDSAKRGRSARQPRAREKLTEEKNRRLPYLRVCLKLQIRCVLLTPKKGEKITAVLQPKL